jgi:hypothetical protein
VTAPPNGEIVYSSPNVGPVYFAGNNHVEVEFLPTQFFGTTPTAYVHS